jgi:hypothetical protein
MPREYSTSTEKFSVSLLATFLRIPDEDATHLGASGEPDGLLSKNGKTFATVEVQLAMNNFSDSDRPNGSGWPDIVEVLKSNPPMQLDNGCGSWLLHVTSDRANVEKLLTTDSVRESINEQVKNNLLGPSAPSADGFSSDFGVLEGPYFGESQFPDQCQLVVHHSQFHGFINSSGDVVSLFLQEKVNNFSLSVPEESLFVKWAKQADNHNVDEIHIVLVYEGQSKWEPGMHFKLFAEPGYLPEGGIDLSKTPAKQWNFWIVARNPNTNEFLTGFSYRAGVWERLSPIHV